MNAMKPLMSEQMYSAFSELREAYFLKHPESNPAHVFVPVSAAATDAPFRLLVVGQATRGWGEPKLGSYKGSAEAAEECLHAHFQAPPKNSAFWQFIRDVVLGALHALGQDVDAADAEKCVAWSNLAKIGYAGGANPDGRLVTAQAGLCIEQLRHEIAVYEPDAVLLIVSQFARDEINYPVFGPIWDRSDDEHTEFKDSQDMRTRLVWVDYPLIKPAAQVASMREQAIALIAGAVRKLPLPA